MKIMHRIIIIVLISFFSFLLTVNAIAKTAAEVFVKASKSVVVVQIQDEKGKTIAFGSGVVSPNGDVVTNCHVIENAVGIKVYQGKKDYNADPHYNDADRDVCSLSVPGMKAPTVSIGNTKTLKVGSRVYAIGAPQGLTLTFSEGIISSKRTIDNGQYLQITAPISPGSSGGGLFDEEGRLIGLTTFYIAEGQQLNFAVPVEWIGELSKRHKKNLKTEDKYLDWVNRAEVLQHNKDWEGLLNYALKRIKAFPQDDNAWSFVGFAYSNLDQYTNAIEAYKQVIKINPENVQVWDKLATIYIYLGQTTNAIEASQQVLRINPESEEGWFNLGVSYLYSGQYAKSIDAYKQAIRINPEHFAAWHNLGIVYNLSGQTEKVMKVYKRLKSINPAEADKFFNEVILP